jgi:hypothetical protein
MALTGDIMVRFDEWKPSHYRLFNIRTVVAPAGADPVVPPFLTPLGQSGRFRIFEAPGGSFFDLVDVVASVKTTRNNFYDINDRWLASDSLIPIEVAGKPVSTNLMRGYPRRWRVFLQRTSSMNLTGVARIEREIAETAEALRFANVDQRFTIGMMRQVALSLAAELSGFATGERIGEAIAERSGTSLIWSAGEILLMFPPVKLIRAPNEIRRVLESLRILHAKSLENMAKIAALEHREVALKRELEIARSEHVPPTRKPFNVTEKFDITRPNGKPPNGNGHMPGGGVTGGGRKVHVGPHPPIKPAGDGQRWVLKETRIIPPIRHSNGFGLTPPQKLQTWVTEPI